MELLGHIAEGVFHCQLLFMVGEGQVAHGGTADPFLKYRILRSTGSSLMVHAALISLLVICILILSLYNRNVLVFLKSAELFSYLEYITRESKKRQ